MDADLRLLVGILVSRAPFSFAAGRSETDPTTCHSVCIVSIVRLMQLLQTQNHPSVDFSYDSTDLVYWTSIEVQGAIVCACAVTLKPLLNQWMPQWFTIHRHNFSGQDPAPVTIGQGRSRRNLKKMDPETTGHDSWTRPSKDLESGSGGDREAGAFVNINLEDDGSEQRQPEDATSAVQLIELPPESRRDSSESHDAILSLPLRPSNVRTRSLIALRGLEVGAFLDDSSIRTRNRSSDSGHHRSLTSPEFYDTISERTDWDLERTVSAGSTRWRG